jgi:hypothetical protein
MKTLISIILVATSAVALPAAAPQLITKGKAPVVVLPRYLVSASEATNTEKGETVALEKFVVTGSVIPKAEQSAAPIRMHRSKR